MWGSNFVDDGNTYYKAIEIYKKLYPKVNITFDFFDISQFPGKENETIENYFNQLQTQVMAGSAPDVFEIGGIDVDIDKIIRSGSLADMYDYFEMWDLLLKIDSEHRDEFTGEKLIDNMAIADMFPYISGINFMDNEKVKSNFETEEFKKAVDKQKEVLKVYPYARMFGGSQNSGVNELKRKEMAMWSFNFDGINPVLQNMRRLGIEDTVIVPFRDINKKLQATILNNVAVSGSSKNKENAYRFIKILINEEISSRYDENLGAIDWHIPISNIATKKLLEQSMQEEILMYADGANFDYKKTSGTTEEFVNNYLELINDIGGVSDKEYSAIRYNKDGSITVIHATYADGYITFETDRFASFGIALDGGKTVITSVKPTEVPQTSVTTLVVL